ncbi:MAG TPA: radical SAM family heme chaperone HemW [Pseudomonadales bacterium]|nr:radical SAM family heme chaperone HemW [Pseudomonadales bacterium]
MSVLTLPPLSLYIHVPWCVRKCPYCDFNSHAATPVLPEDEYIEALLADLAQDLNWVQGRAIQSIFIGGGTPSLLSVQAYQKLFVGLRSALEFAADIEITMEANPGTFEAEKFAGYFELGINRLSIGIQSFNSEFLEKLGRVHDGEQALKAVQIAKDAGFTNFNLDLMHGLPGQSIDDALADLQQAIDFAPPHLSWYQLTIEPNTEFYKRPPVLPVDDALWDIQEAGLALLQKHGYQHYEISAHAKTGFEARHNINYWQFGDYLGIGAGAHGKITFADSGEIIRSQKTRMPSDYLDINKLAKRRHAVIEADEIGLECLMNALRLKQGISVLDFQQRTGLTLEDVKQPIQKAIQLGLLEVGTDIKATYKGQQYLNELLALFLSE